MIDVIATETDMMGRSGQIVEIHSETQVVDTIFSRCISFTFFILLIVFFTCLVFLYSSYGGIITCVISRNITEHFMIHHIRPSGGGNGISPA